MARPTARPHAAAELADNVAMAEKLREYAGLLEQQGEDGFRVRAYRRAADVVAALDRPVAEILSAEGRDGLVALPAIGRGIAGALAEMATTGNWGQLARLRGEASPERLFLTLPGIGPKLAHRIAAELDVDTLEELEMAAHDGRLEALSGVGPRRVSMLRGVLAQRLGRTRIRAPRRPAVRPPVDMILAVDRLYREKAEAGELRLIAPKRFNPEGKAWLPILHAHRGDWHFTVLFSNTGLAHELGRIRDWVVVYYQHDGQPEGQCTVVTETHGPRTGQRVVRGRESEQV